MHFYDKMLLQVIQSGNKSSPNKHRKLYKNTNQNYQNYIRLFQDEVKMFVEAA